MVLAHGGFFGRKSNANWFSWELFIITLSQSRIFKNCISPSEKCQSTKVQVDEQNICFCENDRNLIKRVSFSSWSACKVGKQIYTFSQWSRSTEPFLIGNNGQELTLSFPGQIMLLFKATYNIGSVSITSSLTFILGALMIQEALRKRNCYTRSSQSLPSLEFCYQTVGRKHTKESSVACPRSIWEPATSKFYIKFHTLGQIAGLDRVGMLTIRIDAYQVKCFHLVMS